MQIVNSDFVAYKTRTLSFVESASLPLTSITALEGLFEKLNITKERDSGKNILILAGAGGVGSIAIQLAKKIANMNVIATASRPESIN